MKLQVESSTDTDRASILLGDSLDGASSTDYANPPAPDGGSAGASRRRKPSIEQRRTMAQTMKLGLTANDANGKFVYSDPLRLR